MKILFVCSAGDFPEIGTGHFVRMFTVANQIRQTWNYSKDLTIHFTGVLSEKFKAQLSASSIFYFRLEELSVSLRELSSIKVLTSYDVIVLDILDTDLSEDFRGLNEPPIIISIDNFDSSKLIDLRLFSTRNLPPRIKGSNLIFFAGANEVINKESVEREFIDVFCSFGGFDSNAYSSKLIDYLIETNHKLRINWKFAVSEPNQLIEKCNLSTFSNIEILRNQSEFLAQLSTCDIAVVSGGLTMFQSLYFGRPTIVIPQYNHQYETALKLENLGACLVTQPTRSGVDFPALLSLIEGLSESLENRRSLSRRSRLAVPENSLDRMVEVISLYEFLKWDSEFFGFGIARLHSTTLNARILKYVLAKATIDKVDCLYYLDSGESYESLKLARENGFDLVDTRLTFEKSLEIYSQDLGDLNQLRVATPSDSSELLEIAKSAYSSSRYFFDRNFEEGKCQEFYVEWVNKSILGNLDDYVLLREIDGVIAGYVTVKVSRNFGAIGLIGVREDFRENGIGTSLLQGLEVFLSRLDVPLIRVVTQGRNIAAQNLYSRCGYSVVKSEYWFHRWNSESRLARPAPIS
jgi:dTDP-4-amino-4,6-dideoxy-D-galactose acyltransferase